MPVAHEQFLKAPATSQQLLAAMKENQQEWLVRNALVAGGTLDKNTGVACIHTPYPNNEISIILPLKVSSRTYKQLDTIILDCYRQADLQQAGCWSIREDQSQHCGVFLAARGFEWGWQPHWMWFDLRNLQPTQHLPAGLRIKRVEDEVSWDIADLPYYSRETASHLHKLVTQYPDRIWHFAAWLDAHLVGQSMLSLTTGNLGVAGIYNVGVIPGARRRGIGAALTLQVCRVAQDLGYRYAVLNATAMGERIYKRVGFQSLAYGQTWWLHHATLQSGYPDDRQIALAEAIGYGDIPRLDSISHNLSAEFLDNRLPCGMTPFELTATSRQDGSARWLVAHGATPDLLSAWDLGWKDQVQELVLANPAIVNRLIGKMQYTALHEAVARNDLELARLLLAAKPDLSIEDGTFHSTPLGWAKHFQHAEMVRLIEQNIDPA